MAKQEVVIYIDLNKTGSFKSYMYSVGFQQHHINKIKKIKLHFKIIILL